MSKRRILIAPSLLAADFTRLADEIAAVKEAGADWLHIDVMDGHFVDNMTIGAFIVKQIRAITDLPLDVHLMIDSPERWVERYIDAGADYLTVHVEATVHLHKVLQTIKSCGAKAAVSLNPATHPQVVECVLDLLDMVLVMSVNPGFGGQTYIPSIERKVEFLDTLRRKEGIEYLIEIDGGVNPSNARRLAQLGADVLVAGSAIFGTDDYSKAIAAIRGAL